jgi:hypothetical protein
MPAFFGPGAAGAAAGIVGAIRLPGNTGCCVCCGHERTNRQQDEFQRRRRVSLRHLIPQLFSESAISDGQRCGRGLQTPTDGLTRHWRTNRIRFGGQIDVIHFSSESRVQ